MSSPSGWNPGDVVRIPLTDGTFGFARVLKFPLVAFYDVRGGPDLAPERAVESPIAFRILVMKYAITGGGWEVVGSFPLGDDLKRPPRFFVEDSISGELSITYDGSDSIPATLEDVQGLECAAVWDPEHVVDRLLDHFAGRPNKWVESMRPGQQA